MFSSNPVVSTMLALGITLALIWLGTKLITIISRQGILPGILPPATLSSSPPSKTLSIEASLSIAPRRRITVLRYGDQRLAVLTGGPLDVSLGWLPPASPSSSP